MAAIPIPAGVSVIGTSRGIQHLSNGTYRDVASGQTASSLAKAQQQFGVTSGSTAAPAGSAQSLISNKTPLTTPNEEINAQQSINGKQAAQDNTALNANTNGYGGTETNTVDPNTGQITTNETLSGANQGVVQGLQNAGTAAGTAQNNLLQGAFQSLSSAQDPNAPITANSPYEQALYQEQTQNLKTQQTQDTAKLQQQLYNQGIPTTSPQYKDAMNNLQNQYANYFQTATNNAVTGAAQQTDSALSALSGVQQAGYYNPNFTSATGVNLANAGLNSNVNTDVNTQGNLVIGNKNAASNATSAGAAATSAGAAASNAQTNAAVVQLGAQPHYTTTTNADGTQTTVQTGIGTGG